MKKYRGWEILKMVEEGKIQEGKTIKNAYDNYIFEGGAFYDKDEDEAGISEFMNVGFEIIPESVTFQEVLMTNKNVKFEHEVLKYWKGINSNDKTTIKTFHNIIEGKFLPLPSIMVVLGFKLGTRRFKEVLSEAKWYIEP